VHGKVDDLGRFSDPSVLILTSLSDGPKHGYAIMTDVAAFSGVGMEPGTLYGALSRLEKRGWIRPLDTDERRRHLEPGPPGPRCPGRDHHEPGRLFPGPGVLATRRSAGGRDHRGDCPAARPPRTRWASLLAGAP
jgi:Transcriptional regulator PadR-like family